MLKNFVGFAMKGRNALSNFRRKGIFNTTFTKKSFLCHRYLKFDEYRSLLVKNLGLKPKAAGKLLYCQQHIFDMPQEDVIKRCELFQELDIDPRTLFMNAAILDWPSHTLRHRVLLLREMGVPYVHGAMLSNFSITMTMRMGLFKAAMGIPETVNVAEKLLECLHEPPPSVPPLEALSERLSVKDYQKRCLRWYVQWRLNVPNEDAQTIGRLLHRMRYRSFRMMGRLFDTLHHDIGLTLQQITRDGCLSDGSAEDLRKIINEIKTFGGVDFKLLISQFPVLRTMEYENVIEVIRLLDEHGFLSPELKRYPEILLVDSKVVASRLKTFEESPELRVLRNNVKVLLLIYRFDNIRIRLEYLRYLNIRYATVRNLTSEMKGFERFIRTGLDGTKKKEVGYLLRKSLKLETKEILQRISKHPYWRHVDLITINDTVDFLLERFAPEDLHDNLQLVLYPREKIAETLESLPEMNQQPDERKYSPKQILAICLYEIERECHFSGDGVWKYDAAPPRRREPVHSELSDSSSDSEVADTDENEESLKECK